MTPENDVDKNTDVDENAEKLDETLEGVLDAPVGAAAAASAAVTDVQGEDGAENAETAGADGEAAASEDQNASAESGADDLENAARAQESGNSDDDPLGFGDQKMEPEDEEASVETQLSAAESKIANQTDQLLRMQAEMENQRKRAQNDVTKAHKFALEKIALDLLPVKDSLEMGLLAATAEDAEPGKIVEGSELTLKMLTQALEKYNIVEINPVDEKFDPEFHQAMSMQPVEGKEPNTVASVMQKGYMLNDRLIRPALVMVAK